MTTLDAVNEILEVVGEPAVKELDPGGTSSEAQAEAILTRINQRVQEEGWAANTLPEKTFSPDTSQEIALPDVLSVRPVLTGYGPQPRRTDPERRIAIRDGKLYDLLENKSTFDEDVTLEVVEQVSFTELPPKLAALIVKAAAVKFQRFKKRGQIDDAFAREELHQARVAALQEDGDLRQVNLLKTPEALAVRGRRHRYPELDT